MTRPGPAFLYLHGFASSARSAKAQAFVGWGRDRGVSVEALDLRVPSMEGLLFSAIVARVREAIDAAGGAAARVALIGSSLGGLAAFRAAEQDARVCAVFAMAPAFRLAERWKATIGDDEWEKWRREGFREVDDQPGTPRSPRSKAKVHFGFVSELENLDIGSPDVRVPTCIVHGTKDEVVDIDRSRDFSREKRHVRLVEIDDGHELVASVPRILSEADAFFAPFGIRPVHS